MTSRRLFLTAGDEEGEERTTINRCSAILREGTWGSLFQLSSLRKRPRTAPLRPGEDPVEYQHHLPHRQQHRSRCFSKEDRSSSSPPRLREEDEEHQEPSSSSSTARTSILCLYRTSVWWMRPAWVDRFRDVPPETVLVLWKDDDGVWNGGGDDDDDDEPQQQQTSSSCYRLLLPVALPLDDDRNFATSALRGTTGAATKDNNNNNSGDDSEGSSSNLVLCSSHAVTALYEGSHPDDPYALLREAVEMASGVWRRQRQQRPPRQHQKQQQQQQQQSTRRKRREANRSAPRQRPLSTTSTTTPAATTSSPSPPPPALRKPPPKKEHHPGAAAGRTMKHALGWCTWNAFYTRVTAPKILEGLEKLQQTHRVPVRWMILDDGWQDTVGSNDNNNERDDDDGDDCDFGDGEQWSRRLVSLREDRRKFPPQEEGMTLAETVARLKEKLDAVVVWHTLSGYWLGLQPSTTRHGGGDDDDQQDDHGRRLPSSQLHYPWFSRGLLDNDPRLSQEFSVTRGIGIADAPADFFQQYHGRFLSEACGIDGVKVDAQAVVGALRNLPPGRAESFNTDNAVGLSMQKALVDSVQRNFVSAAPPTEQPTSSKNSSHISPVIHCMAHAPELFYRLPSLYESTGRADSSHRSAKPFFRASDDFYPGNPASHGPQIVACAFNSLLFQHVALPDWDMFQMSLHDEHYRRMHAVARCLSGGPVYISDDPDDPHLNHRAACLDWLCCPDGTTLPCLRAGVPVRASLLQNPLLYRATLEPAAAAAPPFMIWNVNGESSDSVTSGIVGVFHLYGSGDWDREQQAFVINNNDGTGPTKSVQAVVRPFDVPDFAGDTWCDTKFLARSFFSEQVKILESRKDSMTLDLQPLQSDAVVFHPIFEVGNFDFVALGMEGRINGAGAVQNVQVGGNESSTSSSVVSMAICGCGAFVMAARSSSSSSATSAVEKVSVLVNGSATPHKRDHADESSGSYRELRRLGFDVFAIDLAPCTGGHEVVVKFKRD